MKTSRTAFAAHNFTTQDFDNGTMPFDPMDYSFLKFGCDATAKKFGWLLADRFFAAHGTEIVGKPAVVVPSPYNYVPNAATVMTTHMMDRLNHRLIDAGGSHLDYAVVNRKVTYTKDYGFLAKEERWKLIAQDHLYLSEDFMRGKVLIFTDDIRITGSHEERVSLLMDEFPSLKDNQIYFLYYARLMGECRPEIEAALNFSGIKTLEEYLALSQTPNHHVIVRPIKFLLTRPEAEFRTFLQNAAPDKLLKLYHGAIGEGYYDKPDFAVNFPLLQARVHELVPEINIHHMAQQETSDELLAVA